MQVALLAMMADDDVLIAGSGRRRRGHSTFSRGQHQYRPRGHRVVVMLVVADAAGRRVEPAAP